MKAEEKANFDLQEGLLKSQKVVKGEKIKIIFGQFFILLIILSIWEFCTRLTWLVEDTVLDPFFISRPSLIITNLYSWALGNEAGFLWPHLFSTLKATFLGLLVGAGSGFLIGLLLSQSPRMAKIFHPYIVAMNSLPRIALVPLITMIFGLGLLSKVLTAWFVVFFLVFFNAYKGGLSIEPEIIQFCRTLGANNRQITWGVRIPNSLCWVFAALPNAVSFSLIGVVIAEFVGSEAGMGYLLIVSLATLNATDMFTTIVLLGVVGLMLVQLFGMIEQRILHWAPEFRNVA
jgi:NitT/TauT family transport system permease protein